MSDINYEEEVLRIYPDAMELDNETPDIYPSVFWISDGHGNDISDDCKSSFKAWESAYYRLPRVDVSANQKSIIMSECNHQNFRADVKVNRLTEDDKVTIKGFSADIRIECHECGKEFEFVGVEPGVSPFGPRVSIDSTQLRVPIKPSTGKLAFESDHVKLN